MKILIIAESINIEDSSGSKVNVALIHNLVKAGFNLKVLHYTRKDVVLEGVECVSIKERKWNLLYFLSRSQRIFTRMTSININPIVEKLFGFSFTFFNDINSIAKALKREKEYKPDLIITLSKGASFRPHYAVLKCMSLHSKWLAYIHDPYPFHYYPRPYNWIEYGYRQKERFVSEMFSSARYIGYPSQLLMEWMESYFEQGKTKGIVIPHQIGNNAVTESIPDYFNTDHFNLLHAGNLLKERNPEFLIQAFLKFLDKNPNAKNFSRLFFIGPNDSHKILLEKYSSHDAIIIKAKTDYATVQLLEKKSSVNIILEAISEISPFLPGKFPNLIIANNPILILSPYYSETKRVLGPNYPYWAESKDVDKIEALISTLFFEWNNNKEKLYLNRYDLVSYCNEEYLKKIVDSL